MKNIFKQKIIDTHHHLWNLSKNKYDWIKDINNNNFNSNYLLENFLSDVEPLNLIKTVHIQAEINAQYELYETEWIQKISDNNNCLPNGIIGHVDFLDDEVELKIEKHLLSKNFRGIRQILKYDNNNKSISHTSIDYLNNDNWIKNLSLLQKNDLIFEMLIIYSQYLSAYDVISKYPNILFILNHSLWPIGINSSNFSRWTKAVDLLSSLENVIVKLSGFGELNANWSKEKIKPFILYSIDKFGSNRCMFGSNFPVDKYVSQSKYLSFWEAYFDIVSDFSEDEIDRIFYKNAEKFYKI
jgi:predicted TIM-barrel fold metal-dependent hydrolase|tara:strand:+ start:349 stop:1242 length:894 start_codon:yes stop_codon:yes gene_type:complete